MRGVYEYDKNLGHVKLILGIKNLGRVKLNLPQITIYTFAWDQLKSN